MSTPTIITGKAILQRGSELEVELLSSHPAGGKFTIALEAENVAEAFAGLYEAQTWEEIGQFLGTSLMQLLALTPPTPDGDENYRQAEIRKTFKENGLPKIIASLKELGLA